MLRAKKASSTTNVPLGKELLRAVRQTKRLTATDPCPRPIPATATDPCHCDGKRRVGSAGGVLTQGRNEGAFARLYQLARIAYIEEN